MATTTIDNRNNNGLIILLALAAIAAIALGTLELSTHAAQGRENTSLDAATIAKMMDNGTCKPIEAWECPLHDQQKIICKLKGNLWGGIIKSTTVNPPIIITGYPAPYSYWQRAVVRDECYLTMYTP